MSVERNGFPIEFSQQSARLRGQQLPLPHTVSSLYEHEILLTAGIRINANDPESEDDLACR